MGVFFSFASFPRESGESVGRSDLECHTNLHFKLDFLNYYQIALENCVQM